VLILGIGAKTQTNIVQTKYFLKKWLMDTKFGKIITLPTP
jgi:hypothetical protein